MHTKVVDLYQHYSIPALPEAKGQLNCYWAQTPPQVSATRRKSAILVLPGGGYHHLSHREHEPVALHLLSRGFQVFVLEYTVAPARFPVALREAAWAMRYIRENAGEFGVDPGKVAAVGFSAGGHLCGTLGTLYDSPEVADIAPAEVIRPEALGLCYPVAVSWGNTHQGSFQNLCGEDQTLKDRLSLDRLVRGDMPPSFLWHSRSDESVPCRNSLELARAMEAAQVEFALHIYRQGSHGVSTADIHAYPQGMMDPVSGDLPGWMDAMTGFFGEVGLGITD